MAPRIVLPRQLPRLDAADTTFFQRELDTILAEQFDPKYAALACRQFIPMDTSIDPGSETVRWQSFDAMGQAKLIRDFSKDFPEVQVNGTEATTIMASYGDGFGYTIDELRAASKARRPLDRMRADAARKVMNQQFDKVMSLGDSLAGLNGFLRLSNTTTAAPVSKTGGGNAWTNGTATGAEMVKDLFTLLNSVPAATAEVEQDSKKIVLPPANLRLANQTYIDTVSKTTVAQFFLENSQGATLSSWDRCTTAGGTLNTTRAVCYAPDMMRVRGLVAIEFEMMAPELEGMRYTVACRCKIGGVISPYPKSISYMDGI